MAGYTFSNDGSFSNHHGLTDAWVLKVDANGNVQWNKLFGGMLSDMANAIIAAGSGFMITGSTSDNNNDFSGNRDGADSWVMKVDGNGNKQWVKMLGGTRNDYTNRFIKTMDGGFIMSGFTESNDGDLNGNHGTLDAWVIKMKP